MHRQHGVGAKHVDARVGATNPHGLRRPNRRVPSPAVPPPPRQARQTARPETQPGRASPCIHRIASSPSYPKPKTDSTPCTALPTASATGSQATSTNLDPPQAATAPTPAPTTRPTAVPAPGMTEPIAAPAAASAARPPTVAPAHSPAAVPAVSRVTASAAELPSCMSDFDLGKSSLSPQLSQHPRAPISRWCRRGCGTPAPPPRSTFTAICGLMPPNPPARLSAR